MNVKDYINLGGSNVIVPFQLTEDEINEIMKAEYLLLIKLDSLEEERKKIAAEFRKNIDLARTLLSQLIRVGREGKVKRLRDVNVKIEEYENKKVVCFYSSETGELIYQRELAPGFQIPLQWPDESDNYVPVYLDFEMKTEL